MAANVAELPHQFAAHFPRAWVAGLLFLVAWLGRGVPALDNATTRVIQVMDLALVTPLGVVGGVLLLRRQPWGYLLASVAVLKGLTMALAPSTLAMSMTLASVTDGGGLLGRSWF